MANFHKNSSPYADTPVRDFYLDLYVPIKIPKSASDEEYTIESKYHQRPDLLAYDRYGSPRLMWVFASFNKDTLIDPIYDFNAGTTIMLPSKRTVEGLI